MNFPSASLIQFRAPWYIILLYRTSNWNVMTIRISGEHPLSNFERLDILCAWIGHLCEMLWPCEFLESFRCSISSIPIYYACESDIRVKSYYHLNLSRASVVQFRASRYFMRLNRTSVWKVMTNCICRALPLFNFKHLDILCAWIGHLCKMLWSFEFLESFSCSISSVSTYYAPESDIRVKSYNHLNFSSASIVQFRETRYIMRLNRASV